MVVFTDLENNRFQNELMMQNTIYEYSPLQLSTLAMPLTGWMPDWHVTMTLNGFPGARGETSCVSGGHHD